MNILILVNNATDFPVFFDSLGRHLKECGHKVFYAFDSHLPSYTYKEAVPTDQEKCFYFSDYFAKESEVLRPEFRNAQLWRMMYADFERFDVFDLHKDKPNQYFEKLLVALLHFFDDIFTQRAIDVVLFENVSNTFAFAAHEVAKKHGKQYLGISSSRLPGRFEIHTEIFDVSKAIETKFQELLAAPDSWTTSPYISEYLAKLEETVPDYMKNNSLAADRSFRGQYFKLVKFKYLMNIIQYLRDYRKEVYYAYQAADPLRFSFKMIFRTIKRKWNLLFLSKFFVEPKETDRFYLYPLHFHPESSTSVLAPDYIDELATVRNIAFSLPFGSYLYVKDHKSAAGYQDSAFYRKLQKIPNVKLIHFNANIKALIRKSQGVVTLTSTAGYEALLLGKPVYLLGRVFYEFHPNCTRVQKPSDLFEILSKEPKAITDLARLKLTTEAFAEAYLHMTYEGCLDFADRKSHQGVFKEIQKYLLQSMKRLHHENTL